MKTTKLILLLLSALLIVVGCKKTDPDILTPESLAGEWKRTGDAAGAEFWTLIHANGTGKTAIFTHGKLIPSFIQFHWNTTGKTLNLTDYATGENIVCEITKLTKDELQMNVTYPWDLGNKRQETWLKTSFSAKFPTPQITLTTKRTDNTIKLNLGAKYSDENKVYIDLNNNGEIEKGEGSLDFSKPIEYTFNNSTITIYGKITYLNCKNNEIIALDISKNSTLNHLDCSDNQLKVTELHKIIDDLPMREPDYNAEAHLYMNPGTSSITDAYKKKAKNKNWKIKYVNEK